jgi:hypothetical protein
MTYDPRNHAATGGGIAAAWVATLLIGALALGGPTAFCTSVQAAQAGIHKVETYAQTLGTKLDPQG